MSELYELPDEWEWKKLGDLAEYINGMAFKPEDFTESGYPIIRIQNLNGKNQFNYFNGEAKERYYVKNGDILISWSASLDVYKWNGGDAILNQHIFNTNINLKLVNYDFFYHIIKYALKEIMNNLHGVGMKHITKGKFENIKIPLPSLPEQQRIVSKLDLLFEKIDKSIALHQKNMDEANAFMGSVLNDVFGELEEKYEKDFISNYCQITSSKRVHKADYVDNGIKFYRIKDIVLMSKKIQPTDTQYIKEETFNEFDKRFGSPKSGDILLTAVGATLGYAYLVNDNDGKIYFKDGNLLWLRNINNLDKDYLAHIFKSPLFDNYLDEISKGAAQPAITIIKLKEFNIPIPPFPIQQKVVIYLDEISQKLEKIKQLQKEKMASLKALKASILDSAFRGEL